MFRAVVVPLDGTEFAARALPIARSLAQLGDATVHVIGVARSDAELPRVYDHVHECATEVFQGDNPVDAEVDIVVDPDPVEVLLGVAAKDENVLCLASRDRPAPAATLMHSVGSEVMERASRPLVVVGRHASPHSGTTDVVVALDPREDPEPPLVTAAAWALQLHARLRIVSVFEPVPSDLDHPDHFSRRHGPSGDPDAYVAAMAQRVEDIDLPGVETVAIPDPVSPASGLLDHLRDNPALLIVLGARRRNVPDLGLGVARHLLISDATPILIVPHDG